MVLKISSKHLNWFTYMQSQNSQGRQARAKGEQMILLQYPFHHHSWATHRRDPPSPATFYKSHALTLHGINIGSQTKLWDIYDVATEIGP